MESTAIPTAQMTGTHTIPAGYRAARRWIATRTILIPVGYRAAHRRIAIRTNPIPAEYRAVRRLEITAMEEITKAAEVVEAAEAITILVIKAAIIEGLCARNGGSYAQNKDRMYSGSFYGQ